MKSELGKAGVVVLILALGGAALLSDPLDASASIDARDVLGSVTELPQISQSPYEPYTRHASYGDQPGHTLLLMSGEQLENWRPSVGPDYDEASSFFMMNR